MAYKFDPSADDDGITLTVPLVLLLDVGAGIWAQRALGAGTWLLLLLAPTLGRSRTLGEQPSSGERPRRRVQLRHRHRQGRQGWLGSGRVR